MSKPILRTLHSLPWLVCVAALGLWATVIRAADPSDNAPEAMIYLTNGDHVTGRLVDSLGSDFLAWQSPVFSAPFEFLMPTVNSIQFPVPAKLTPPQGNYCFELAGGDVLFGSLVALQGNEAELDVSGIGRLHVDRAVLRRMYRWHGATELVFFGPSGLKGWQLSGNTKAWREETGHLIADQSGAVLRRDFGLPPLARFEFELSWKNKPDFELALGVSDSKSALRAFRFEVWENELVVQRETEREADLASLQTLNKTGSGRIHLQAFLDQPKGHLLVFSSNGQPLADLTVTTGKAQSLGGLQLTNKSGDIRLERLSIGRWNGELPQAIDADKSRIHATDGSITYGQLRSYDAAQHEFVVEAGTTQRRIAEDRVQDVFFSQENEVTPRSLRAVHLSGQRISGDLVKVEQNKVWLKCPGIREAVASPVEELQSLTGLAPKDVAVASGTPTEPTPRVGRLEAPGLVLRGNLAETRKSDPGCLLWKPVLSRLPSPLQPAASARIVYRDPPPPPKPLTPQQQAQLQAQQRARAANAGGLVGQMQNLLAANASATPKPRSKQTKPVLHLRSGDTIPCDVTAIDEKGVTFAAANTEATFIRHDQLKAIELMADATPVQIAKPKKERLLMLPRMQRDNPPTQLIRSVDGDYLRGRLLSMDDQQLQIEIRLETKTLQRERVARIIWLHPDEIDGTVKPAATSGQPVGTRVQALPSDGNRLTFIAEEVVGTTLSGHSELLGVCRVDLQQIDQLLIGPAIEQAAATLAFHQWRLKSAADPLAAREDGDGSGDGMEGQESALVGKPAPDIELDLLDGTKFRLSERNDKIVVLDFWASWCGPCLQVMPQIDKVTHEFADQGVELVAINLEETGDRIQATLDRLKLKMPVALDRDGRTAEKYGATAIPQTVIVDRSGKVARLFVGGGARFGDQLRTALQAVLSDELKKSD